jgi:hypothetical protein
MKHFAEEIWKKGQICMMMLTGFKDDKWEIFSQKLVIHFPQSDIVDNAWTRYDFNNTIANGQTLSAVDGIQGPFDRFLTQCYRPTLIFPDFSLFFLTF